MKPDTIKHRINTILTAAILALTSFLLANCTPSELVYKEHALYNFTDEGFLSMDMVQTRASSPYPIIALGNRGIRRVCTEEAMKGARNKMLRIFLHTYFRIPAGDSSYINDANQFTRDYPVEFSPSDYIRAEIDFRPILEKGFIALQDTRSAEECSVVFRIRETDLTRLIRATEVTFMPAGIRRDYDLMNFRRYEKGDRTDINADGTRKITPYVSQ